jgi:hypothetical protein
LLNLKRSFNLGGLGLLLYYYTSRRFLFFIRAFFNFFLSLWCYLALVDSDFVGVLTCCVFLFYFMKAQFFFFFIYRYTLLICCTNNNIFKLNIISFGYLLWNFLMTSWFVMQLGLIVIFKVWLELGLDEFFGSNGSESLIIGNNKKKIKLYESKNVGYCVMVILIMWKLSPWKTTLSKTLFKFYSLFMVVKKILFSWF